MHLYIVILYANTNK